MPPRCRQHAKGPLASFVELDAIVKDINNMEDTLKEIINDQERLTVTELPIPPELLRRVKAVRQETLARRKKIQKKVLNDSDPNEERNILGTSSTLQSYVFRIYRHFGYGR